MSTAALISKYAGNHKGTASIVTTTTTTTTTTTGAPTPKATTAAPTTFADWAKSHTVLLSRRRRSREGEHELPVEEMIAHDKILKEAQQTAALMARARLARSAKAKRLFKGFTKAPPLTAAQRSAHALRRRERRCAAAHRYCKGLFDAPVEQAGRSVFALSRRSCSSATAWASQPMGNRCLFNDACVACVDYSKVRAYLRERDVLGALGGRSLRLRDVQAHMGKRG